MKGEVEIYNIKTIALTNLLQYTFQWKLYEP